MDFTLRVRGGSVLTSTPDQNRENMAYKKKTFTEERPALRVPPYSAEAEQAVLGAILLDAPRAMEICWNCSMSRLSVDFLTTEILMKSCAGLSR